MKTYTSLDGLQNMPPSVVTVGTFDGCHRGHLEILEQVKQTASRRHWESTVVTFDPHPRLVVSPDAPVQLLTTTAEKLELFEAGRIDQVVVIPFTREFARHSSEAFVAEVLVGKLRAKSIVIGYDHHFGRNREGGVALLEQLSERLGFSVHRVPPFENGGEVVSSSLIRQLVQQGQVDRAAKYLGRPYSLSGVVAPGERRGRQIGFPTANIVVDHPYKLIPREGVYAVKAKAGKTHYAGMMNIGRRPTFNSENLTLEVHLFNFDASLYQKALTVHFLHYIRPEQKFSGIEELRAQLEKDKIECEKYIS